MLRNDSKYEFLTGENVLPEKDLLEKAAIMKRFEHLAFSKELETQIDIAKKQYRKLEKVLSLIKQLKKNSTQKL